MMAGGANDGAQMPTDPITAAAEASTATKVMYDNLRAAGFSVIEACTIIGTMLAVAVRGGQTDD